MKTSMKQFLSFSLTVFFTVIALCFQTPALAQDDDFPELASHEVALQQVVKEWHSKGLYTAGWAEKPTIRNYFVGLANAYPGDLFQMMVGKMLGLGTDIRLIFVPEIGEEDVVTTLAWDGTRFTVKLPQR